MAKIITKEEAIEELIDDVEEWGTWDLIKYVKAQLRQEYNSLSLKSLENAYNSSFVFANNEKYIISDTKAAKLLIQKRLK